MEKGQVKRRKQSYNCQSPEGYHSKCFLWDAALWHWVVTPKRELMSALASCSSLTALIRAILVIRWEQGPDGMS